MSVFDGIENAQVWENKGSYLLPGSYDLEIVSIKSFETRKKERAFVAEFKVLGTSNKEINIGAVHSWFTSSRHENFLSNVKAMATALLSTDGPIDPSQITAEIMDSLVDKDGATVRGSRIRCDVRLVDTKSGGKFSAHTWRAAGAMGAGTKDEQADNSAPAGEQQAAAN